MGRIGGKNCVDRGSAYDKHDTLASLMRLLTPRPPVPQSYTDPQSCCGAHEPGVLTKKCPEQ